MPVSGRVSQNQFTLQQLLDSAFRRIGVPAQTVTSEYLDTARGLLQLTLDEFVTTGVSLWTNGVSYLGMQPGKYQVTLPDGTLEVDRVVVLRTTATPAAVSAGEDSSSWLAEADASVAAEFVGIKVSSAGFYNVAVDTSPDGVTYTQVAAFENVQMFTGQWNWIEINPTPNATTYFRVRETSAAVFPVTGAQIAVGSSEIQLNVEGQDTYANLPNKRSKGTVTSYYTDRRVDGPVLYLWSAPDDAHGDYILQVWRKRHMIDVGSMTGRIEVPARWMDAIIWDLAWRLAAEIPEAEANPNDILLFADRARSKIAPSETDGGVVSLRPDISMYTA